MSVVSVKARSFILALFIRDDGERFLLGDNGYDFKDTQLHFAANTIENDEVMKQGADGVMVAGQVRRASVQSFDGFVGDATMAKETIEQMRRDFFAFFVKGHHFRVVYIDCNRNAWQRKGGYLVDAPEVKELWQIHPEYHVGLNFEDVNYYSYDEDADGEEILSNLVGVPVSTAASGGLVWDEDGAVSEDAEVDYDTETAGATGKAIAISDAAEAPLASFKLDGETSQIGTPTPSAPVAVNTTTGENVVKICGKNLFDSSATPDYVAQQAWAYFGNGTYTAITNGYYFESGYRAIAFEFDSLTVGQQYTLSFDAKGNSSHNAQVGVNMYTGASGGTHYAHYTIDTTSTRISFTFTATSANRIAFNSGATSGADLTITNIQLELGSTATSYEPYQSQSYGISLTGKNLFNKNSATILNGQINSDKTYDTNNGKTIYIICEPNTTYSVQKINLGSRSRIGTSQSYIPNGGTLTNYSVMSSGSAGEVAKGTITSGENDIYLWVTFAGDSDSQEMINSIIDSIQIEEGSTSTDYSSYSTVELVKIGDYQDYLWNDNGTWKKHKAVGKVVVDGGTVWAKSQFGTNNYSFGASGIKQIDNRAMVISDQVIGVPCNDRATDSRQICYVTYLGSSTAIYVRNITYNTAADLTAHCSSNPMTFYYVLATPTDEEITNAALISQLNALLTTARTYAGINNIFTITPNEQGTLEVGYYTKYHPIVTGGGYVWEAGGAGGATIVVNNSIDNVNPIWKIYGPTMNPQLENSTTGETIEYVGLIAEGQTLTIDMGEQTASLDGLNVISNLVGDFVSLAPGANRLIYSVTGDAGASEIGWSEIVG